MAPLDDNPVLEKGTSLHIGSWIFVADGSGGFKSRSTDHDLPEAAEATKHHEFDEFIDQLEEIGFSDLNNGDRIQPEFDVIKTKTLSELEEDLKKLLEDPKPETSTNGKTTLSNRIQADEPSLQKKKSKTSFKKATRKKKQSKNTFQASMILMKKSSTTSRKLKTHSTSTLLSKNSPTSGLSTLQSWNKIKLSSNISRNWTNQSPKMN